jgi:hypothetical protein
VGVAVAALVAVNHALGALPAPPAQVRACVRACVGGCVQPARQVLVAGGLMCATQHRQTHACPARSAGLVTCPARTHRTGAC